MNTSIYFDDSWNDMTIKTEETVKKDTDGNIMVTRIPLKNATIILMDHPASVTVYQHVSIQVLSGSVSVMGYEIKPGSQPLKVFSFEKTGLIQVKTETYDRIWKKKTRTVNLEQDINSITDDKDKTLEILKQFGNFTVAIVVRCCVLPHNLQYLEFYYPNVLDFNLFKKTPKGKQQYFVPRSKESPIEFGLDAEKLASEINVFVRGAKLTEDSAPRILVYGPKNTGKSSLLRFLINKILSLYVVAYHLDTDPGQTEFTPPGVVSLTKVTKPVIGPPFAHLKTPVSMIFTGGISAESSPDMYCKSIHKLMELYKRNYSDEALFINTMGWMEGLGLHCLKKILECVKPTVLVELVNEDEISMFDYREYLPKGAQYFQVTRSFVPKQSHLQSKEMRNITLLSYFGKCMSPYEGPVHLNEVKPYCVCWDKIPVYLFGKKVPPYRMIEAINASIVALCRVPETAVLESDIPLCPKTLEDEPDNECIGYGLVRGVDEKNHILYIISPLSLNEIKKVNAIIKGNIMVPDVVFLNQPICKVPLPFTNEREILPPPADDDEEMADCSMLSLKFMPDSEFPAEKLTPLNPTKFYREKIRKRHRRSNCK